MDSAFNIQNYFKRGSTIILTLRQGLEDGGNAQGRQWTDKETTLLMDLMNEFRVEFKGQKRRKKEVWTDVTKRMQHHSYMWTPEDCRKKWSNMMRTFKTIEEQRRHSEHPLKKIKWPFFEEMTKLLTTEGADALPEASSVCSYMKEFPIPDHGQDQQQGQVVVDPDGLRDQRQQVDLDHNEVQVDTPGVIIPDLEISEAVDNSHANSVDAHHVHSHTHDPSEIMTTPDQPVPVDTSTMQYYLVDNEDGSMRPSGCGVDTVAGVDIDSTAVTAGLEASSEDFDTLATVAAAAATVAPGADLDAVSGPEMITVPVQVQSTSTALPNFDIKPQLLNQVNMNKFSHLNSQCELPVPVSVIPRIVNQGVVNTNLSVNPDSQVLASQQSQSQGPTPGPLLLPLPLPQQLPVSSPGLTNPVPGKVNQQQLPPLVPLRSQPLMTGTTPTTSTAVPIPPTIVAHRNSAVFLKRKAKFHQRKDKEAKTKRMSQKNTDDSDAQWLGGGGGSSSGLGSETGDPIVDKFIAISNKQNERILERMEKFHEESLNVMRERNKILENMVTFLKQHIGGTSATATATNAASSTAATTGSSALGVTNAGLGLNSHIQNHNQSSTTVITVPAAFQSIPGQQMLAGGSPAKTAMIRVINQNPLPKTAVSSASFIPTVSSKKS